MNAREIQDVLREVFGRNLRVEVTPRWVRMPCPLARWTHERGKDTNPSAGVSVSPGSTSVFSCFTCGNARPFHAMLAQYAGFSGEDLGPLIEELEEQAYMGPRKMPEWDEPRVEMVGDLATLDKAIFMDLYEPAAGHPYLTERGISPETANLLQLMLDPEDPVDGEERILFPVMGLDGSLYGFTGRATSKDAVLKVRDYHGLPKARCVLGAHLFATDRQRLLVVEGLYDYARAWECGHPAVAVMHSTMTPAQADIVVDIGKPAYLFYDNDDAGRKGALVASRALRNHLPVLRPGPYPSVQIQDSTEQGWHWLKDPGELEPAEFGEMIKNATLL